MREKKKNTHLVCSLISKYRPLVNCQQIAQNLHAQHSFNFPEYTYTHQQENYSKIKWTNRQRREKTGKKGTLLATIFKWNVWRERKKFLFVCCVCHANDAQEKDETTWKVSMVFTLFVFFFFIYFNDQWLFHYLEKRISFAFFFARKISFLSLFASLVIYTNEIKGIFNNVQLIICGGLFVSRGNMRILSEWLNKWIPCKWKFTQKKK